MDDNVKQKPQPDNAVVEETILAGGKAHIASATFYIYAKKCGAELDGRPYRLGTIRIAPPLPVPERFRAFITWWPV